MGKQKTSPFYRTLSPIGAAAQKEDKCMGGLRVYMMLPVWSNLCSLLAKFNPYE